MAPKKKARDLEKLLQDDALIESALRAGVREALLHHKQLGLPVVGWRDGKAVWIPAKDIRVGNGSMSRKTGRRRRDG